MKAIFAGVTNLSLRFGAVVLALMAVISVLGVIAITRMRQELIPPIEFPQTIIITQASGMTSDQVLNVVTSRLEAALGTVPDVANLESTTTGAFGSIIIARNDFGMNQERLRNEMRAAIDEVWLPLRQVQAPAGEEAQAFAARLMNDMTPDVLLYLAGRDTNFLFQLAPEAWAALPDETVRAAVSYLAGKTQGDDATALRRLIDQEIIPALETVPQVARISISGGQVLPGENGAAAAQPAAPGEARSQLLGLSQNVWAVISAKIGAPATLDAAAVDAFNDEQVTAPQTPPALPESWQMDRFTDARDLFEMRTLTRTLGAVFNQFVESGAIVGGLGQTDDLSVDDLNQMLALDPTMVEYFKAEQLAALPDDVFAALPADYIASLDGLTRDALAAKALARALVGDVAVPPVDLPQAWRVQQPQFVTFGFDDIPLATFTISGNGLDAPAVAEPTSTTTTTTASAANEPAAAQAPVTNAPEGPALPQLFSLMGEQLGVQLDTADDLLSIQLQESMSSLAGTDTLDAAQFLNFMTFLNDPSALAQAGGGDGGTDAASQFNVAEFLPALTECGVNPLALLGGADSLRIGDIIIGCLSPEVLNFIADNNPTFVANLQPVVFEAFSDAVYQFPRFAPPLDTVWGALADKLALSGRQLATAEDVIRLGGESPSAALATIDANIPPEFSGYEVRLFDSLTPGTLRFFSVWESDFWRALDPDVLLKLSPEALASMPDDVRADLPDDVQTTLAAIIDGDQPSAAAAQAERYATDAPPADPNAPALNADWQFVGDFMGVELDTADDLFRFFPTPINFLNGFWDTAQGIAFAPRLFGNISPTAFSYWVDRDPTILTDLRIDALQLLPDDVVSTLPQDVQDRITSGELPFVPSETVTRTDGNSSLLVTVFKTNDSNTIEAFYAAKNTLTAIDERNDSINVGLAFEQASFIEESISGVAREGLLGAIFAIIMILIFLSTGVWSRRPRNLVGALLVIVFGVGLFLFVNAQMPEAGGDWGRAFEKADIVWRVMLLGGMVTGLIFLFLPAKLPYPSWRSTLVTAVSIPLSVLMAFAMMHWLSPAIHNLIAPAAENSSLLGFALRLFPADITINIMTLSGLTVAIGRVVDDSIVVLENIFRQVQAGGDRRTAVLTGVRDVSMAIFVATLVTVVVFLPLGLTGGLIGAFFLPFGLAVTYSLIASFIVAITVVPLLAYLLLDPR
ncbi:MAG: efflux RND transporter permease subunit, partial [Anaerolineae bacterium]|nr:efflux RND transporter permease subunit [Anaerolineae bacterium]